MRKIDIVANANTHSNFSSSFRAELQTGSWLGRLGQLVARLTKSIVNADEVAHALRRRRYASLLG
jgi:hypothetical protein